MNANLANTLPGWNPTPQKPKLTRSQVGTLGGRAGRGDSKRRTPEQARKAVMVRWNRVKQQNAVNTTL